jgi:hypothetical protein
MSGRAKSEKVVSLASVKPDTVFSHAGSEPLAVEHPARVASHAQGSIAMTDRTAELESAVAVTAGRFHAAAEPETRLGCVTRSASTSVIP